MPNLPISQLPSAGTLTGSEPVPVVANGVTSQASTQQIANLAAAAGGPGANKDLSNLSTAGQTAVGTLAVANGAASSTLNNVTSSVGLSNLKAAQTVLNIAGLRALAASGANLCVVQQYASVAGIGGGVFQYVASDTTSADNGGTIITPTATLTGRWYRVYSGLIDPRWFGAVADGVTDTAAKLTAADSIGPILLSGGTYAVASSIGFSNAFQTDGTGILKPATGYQITFNKTFSAPVAPAFSNATAGLGSVAFGTTTPTVYPQWWGAVAGGGDCSAALVAAAASGLPVVIVNGVFTVSASVTVAAPITILPQASFSVSASYTLTFSEPVVLEWGAQFTGAGNFVFNNSFEAPLNKIFNTSGSVTLNAKYTAVGYPEWWGAQTDNGSFDNRAALTACVESVALTQLQAADYYIGSGPWVIATSARTISGVGFNGDGSAPATRIIGNSTTGDVCLLGSVTSPGPINSFVHLVTIQNVTFTSNAIPAAPSTGIQGGPSCLRIQYAANCYINRCYAYNGTNGIYCNGVVATVLKECQTQRTVAGSTTGNDYYIGVMLDGTLNIGANTGIASVYIDKLTVLAGGQLGGSNGVYTTNGFTDIFIDKVETSGVNVGLNFNGNPSGTYSSEDLHVSNCVLDQMTTGILINAGQDQTAAVFVNNYVATTTGGSSVGIEITSTPTSGIGGSISLIGNQVIGSGGAATGLLVTGSTGVIGSGNIYTDMNKPIVLTSAGNCRLSDRISNPTQTGTAAIAMTGTNRSVIDCTVNGASASFTYGVNMISSANNNNEIRCSGIDNACVSTTKLISNGTAVTTPTTFSTNNLSQGIMN
jgi:hypothetical protein